MEWNGKKHSHGLWEFPTSALPPSCMSEHAAYNLSGRSCLSASWCKYVYIL